MGSDVPHLRYLLPKFKGNYTAFMKTLESSCKFDSSDSARYRFKVIEFGQEYGWKAVRDAFGVKRSTYFLWKQKLKVSLGKLSSLVPISTKPKHTRKMQTDPRIIEFIRQLREQYGRVGKEKLKILLDAYCQEEKISPLKASTIGKVVRRHHFFFEGRRSYRKRRSGVLRVKKAPKEKIPGYFEMDTVIIRVVGETVVFITAIDVVTKYVACLCASTPTSLRAKQLLVQIQQTYCFPIRMIQTDNGSEFLGKFDVYCQEQQITHVFTYPRSPKINGGVERFNRTIQEEFIERCNYLLEGPQVITDHLIKYLSWYNEVRPHHSLGLQSPNQYIQTLQSNM